MAESNENENEIKYYEKLFGFYRPCDSKVDDIINYTILKDEHCKTKRKERAHRVPLFMAETSYIQIAFDYIYSFFYEDSEMIIA